MITTSEKTDKLDAAMAKVNAMVGGLKRSATNPFTKSKYPNLEDVWDVLRPALKAASLSVSQHPLGSGAQGMICLQTRIAIEGQWMTSIFEMPISKWDPQGWGAGLTYAKRYALSAIFGLAEDDDDGNMASGRGVQASTAPDRHHDDPKPTKAPQKAVKRDDWEHAINRSIANDPDLSDPFLTDAAKAEPNEHASYVIRMGKNAGKRIDQVGEPGLRDFIKWVESRTGSGQTVAPLVTEYYEHATAYLR